MPLPTISEEVDLSTPFPPSKGCTHRHYVSKYRRINRDNNSNLECPTPAKKNKFVNRPRFRHSKQEKAQGRSPPHPPGSGERESRAPLGNGNRDDLAAKHASECDRKKKKHFRSFEARVKRLDNRKVNKRNARQQSRLRKAVMKLNDPPDADHLSYPAA